MRIGVPRETAAGERRVAFVPDAVARVVKQGNSVLVESGAGLSAGFTDAEYTKAGATIVPDARSVFDQAELVLKVRRPSGEEAALLAPDATVIALMGKGGLDGLLESFAAHRITALALERVPRITRAQSMDVLSSQSTVSGYKSVLVGAAELGKFLPMLTTAAGSIVPARVFIIGAGVAGLQAIATARRLGGVVSAFDVRAAAREQVQSLGASFVASELVSATAEDKGGYAKAQSSDEQERTLQAIAGHIKDQDLVITTALIPGRPAPRLITDAMVASMRPGSVIVDLAAEAGGNCELTRPGETVVVHNVTILGPTNLPASVPLHASQMFSKNMLTLIQHLVKETTLNIDMGDEITGAMVVVEKGKKRDV